MKLTFFDEEMLSMLYLIRFIIKLTAMIKNLILSNYLNSMIDC